MVHGQLNIVLAKDGRAVIIDFDSCWPVNESLRGKKVGTEVDISLFQNDIDAIEKLRTYLYQKQCNVDPKSDSNT
jgi:predicted Ser/Thr protein kinase